jgi:hypothetical protein
VDFFTRLRRKPGTWRCHRSCRLDAHSVPQFKGLRTYTLPRWDIPLAGSISREGNIRSISLMKSGVLPIATVAWDLAAGVPQVVGPQAGPAGAVPAATYAAVVKQCCANIVSSANIGQLIHATSRSDHPSMVPRTQYIELPLQEQRRPRPPREGPVRALCLVCGSPQASLRRNPVPERLGTSGGQGPASESRRERVATHQPPLATSHTAVLRPRQRSR